MKQPRCPNITAFVPPLYDRASEPLDVFRRIIHRSTHRRNCTREQIFRTFRAAEGIYTVRTGSGLPATFRHYMRCRNFIAVCRCLYPAPVSP
jgi:hypothetical protein